MGARFAAQDASERLRSAPVADLVDPGQIERIVGARRHSIKHLGRVVTADHTTYILHSEHCRSRGLDLRECAFSVAMDDGVDDAEFEGYTDRAIVMGVDSNGVLLPAEIAHIREGSASWPDHSEPIVYLAERERGSSQ